MNAIQRAQQAAIAAARQARAEYRNGRVAPTAGIAPGMTQANLIALPRDWAYDFLLYAQRNPKACPVLDVSDAGSPHTVLAEGADLRTDLPLYRIWRDGKLAEEVSDASAAWAEYPDMVAFLIGCSFTFETGLQEAGIEVRHIADGCNVPMYRSNRACRPAGRLHGEMVVSMRPIPRIAWPRRPAFPGVILRCTAHRCISASRIGSASKTCRRRISAMRCASSPAKCRCSGPAA